MEKHLKSAIIEHLENIDSCRLLKLILQYVQIMEGGKR